ncbi:hypothetical protein G3I51_05985 [Streptomyces sp. SID9944]|nr:hypothetical protein [Streptomyces sp. SID9944]
MPTTTASAPTGAAPAPRRPFMYGYRAMTLIGASLVGLLAYGAAACQSMEGGPVRSAAEYAERAAQTERAGDGTLNALAPAPVRKGIAEKQGDASCVDDFGFDGPGVTRDEAAYEWSMDFASRAAYRSAVDHLRATWTARGLKVKDIAGRPGAGMPGITTTDEHGVRLSLVPDSYSGEPVMRADGGCVRHEYAPAYEEEDSGY